MDNQISNKEKIIIPNKINKKLEEGFNDFLNVLDNAEQNKDEAKKKKLRENYRNWVYHFKLLKDQFKGVYDLFGDIEKKTKFWKRETNRGGCKEMPFIGASGLGYWFKVVIEKEEAPKKWLVVECSYGSGIGDERDIGRPEFGYDLVGLENCTKLGLDHQLSSSEYMLDKLFRQELTFGVFKQDVTEETFGDKAFKNVGVDFLYNHNLKEISQKLFISLNMDEIINLNKEIPYKKK